MKKWKYFSVRDSQKEAIGIVYSKTLNGAYFISSTLKNLPIEEFKKIFRVEMV